MAKHRCRGCRDYFPKEQFWRPAFHTEECAREYALAARRRRDKVIARRDHPVRKDRRRTTFTPELKRRVRERDGNRCRWCGRHGTALHVHHILYRSQGGPDEEWNLTALCVSCHELVHSSKHRYQPVLQATLWLEYFHELRLSARETERWLETSGQTSA